MNTLTGQPWFWPAALVIVGLPLALLILSELHGTLVRRGSTFAKPVALLRNWVLPACAVYLLINQLESSDVDATWSKISATVFGFLIMLLLLSGANSALFGEARSGSWRERLPGIFIDLGRLILIILGIGLLLSWVWGANIGGLVTAVGVTSVVIGLAVQSAVGPIISGLLLLFEQPFRIGDWIDTEFGKGRVVEVNWRAAHIDTFNGIRIVPNAALAEEAFINLSRTTAPFFRAKTTLTFATDDPPGVVKATLLAVADALPAKLAGESAAVIPLGDGRYQVAVPIASPADEFDTNTMLLHRAWYAGQRAGLRLDWVNPRSEEKLAYVAEQIQRIGATLGLGDEAITTMLGGARLLPFAEGETIQSANSIPNSMGFITQGAVGMYVYTEDGRRLPLRELSVGEYIGGTSLTRQRMITELVALTDTTIVAVSREAMNTIAQQDHRISRQIGDAVELRRRTAREALAEAAQGRR